MSTYQDFLASKALCAKAHGLARVPDLAPHLFEFQRHCVEFNLRTGAGGLFLDTGLGKTECQLEFCQKAIEATNERALIWTPLAVAGQTKRRAERWGYEARVIREGSEAGPGINICNYDRCDKIDPADFAIVSLDEASILKSFTGKTTRAMIDAFKGHRFKLVATATPAPNDHMELGNYAEFLEVMAANEMLSRFFINDTSTASQEWRLKGHAITAFWDWLASWARMAEKPSDLTGILEHDKNFKLIPYEIIKHLARGSHIVRDSTDLFGDREVSATTMHDVKRQTIEARAEAVANIVCKEANEPWIIWVDTNYESDALMKVLPAALDIRGSMSIDEKEERLQAFESGTHHVIAKPFMCGHGLDWAHCARMIFAGRSFSYESWYQAVRRCWRFGQRRKLIVHIVVAEGEERIGHVLDRKATEHIKMKAAMTDAMRRAVGQSANTKIAYQPTHTARLAPWLSAA